MTRAPKSIFVYVRLINQMLSSYLVHIRIPLGNSCSLGLDVNIWGQVCPDPQAY